MPWFYVLTLKPPGRRELLPGGAPRSAAAASAPGLAGAADGRHGAAEEFLRDQRDGLS